MIYLDNSATTVQKPPGVMEAVAAFEGNPGRGGHALSLNGAKTVYQCRERLCELFSAPNPERVIFVKNGTEALNLAILGTLSKEDHVVFTSMEHNSVVRPIIEKGFPYSVSKASKDGFITLEQIQSSCKENTRLIVVNHASNVCGSIQPISSIADFAHKNGISILVDAAQSAGVIPINMEKDGIDYLAFSGHKGLLGPLGTGALILGPNAFPQPLVYGGTGSNSENLNQPEFLPDRYESGTLNGCGIAGLNVSIDFLLKQGVGSIEKRKTELIQRLIDGLMNIPDITLYGSRKAELRADAVSFNITGKDCNLMSSYLEEQYELYGRSGMHCSPLSHQTIGSYHVGGTIRISPSYFTTKEDIEKTLAILSKVSKSTI